MVWVAYPVGGLACAHLRPTGQVLRWAPAELSSTNRPTGAHVYTCVRTCARVRACQVQHYRQRCGTHGDARMMHGGCTDDERWLRRPSDGGHNTRPPAPTFLCEKYKIPATRRGPDHPGRVGTFRDAVVSGRYWHHLRQERPASEASDPKFQDRLIAKFAGLTEVALPKT